MIRNKVNRFHSSILGIAIATGISVVPAVAVADVCKDVDIQVNNAKSTKILAQKITYKFKEDGEERTQGFNNVEVGAGQNKIVAFNKNLEGGEGNTMEYIQLTFKAWCGIGAAATWVGPYTSARDTSFLNAKCNSHSGKVYAVDIPATDVCNP